MRVAYIGNFEPPYSTENDVRKAFEHLGHQVIQLQENRVGIPQISRTMSDADMLLITSTWDDASRLEPMIEIFYNCAIEGKPTATLHLDTFWGKSRGGRRWWMNPMFHTAYIFTADGDYDHMWKAYGKNHIWLPPAVRHDAVGRGEFREEYACDVAFVGSNGIGYHEDVWSYRRELVDKLREMCARNKWTFKNPGGDHPKVERDHNMNDFYASAKVTVGDSLCLKRQESHYWSDRVPEATGRGGTLIMPQIDAIKTFYKECIKMYDWYDWAGLEDLVGFLVKGDCARRSFSDGALAITKEHHTYVNRVQTILETVGLA